MGEFALFYESKGGDRKYGAESFEEFIKPFFTTGVLYNNLFVKANDDMTVTVEMGYVNIEGKVKKFETATTLNIEGASGTLERIDSVVVRRNDTERDFEIAIIKGGFSSNPEPPTLTRGGGIYEIKLADIRVPVGAVKITQAQITDTRTDRKVCGWIAATVKEMDFEQFTEQFKEFYRQFTEEKLDEFQRWFEEVKGSLDEDAAGNLKNQIGVLEQLLTEEKENIVKAVNEIHEKTVKKSDIVNTAEEIQEEENNEKVAGINLIKRVAKIYITESGEKDGWLYKKYNDGTCEMTYRGKASFECNVAVGNIYASEALKVKYPFEVYDGRTAIDVTDPNCWASVTWIKENEVEYKVWRGGKYQKLENGIVLFLCGKWKKGEEK